MNRPLRVALLTTESRDYFKDYGNPQPYFGTAPQALLQGFAETPEVEVEVVSCVRHSFESPVQLAPNIRYHALHVPKLGWLSTGYQGCIRAVRRKLRDLKPDIAHGQGTEKDCAISAVWSGCPNVLTIHGNMAELERHCGYPLLSYGWLAARLENDTLPRSAGVFCNSAYTERLVQPRARRVWRVANAVRREFLDTPISMGSGTRPLIMNVGVISPRKRQVEILQMAQELQRDGVDVEFQFIGQCGGHTAYERTFLHRIAAAEKSGYARWLGTMGAAEIIEHFDRGSAVLHFPSEEAFGLVIVEALARNLKFFGSRLGGIIDISRGVELAELHDSNDWTGLRSSIQEWLAGGAPRPETAATTMKQRYDPCVIALRHLEIYREVLGNAL